MKTYEAHSTIIQRKGFLDNTHHTRINSLAGLEEGEALNRVNDEA